MKRQLVLMLLLILISSTAYSQKDEFKVIDKCKIEPIVNVCSEKMANDIYSKAIDWINLTYLNPDDVIKGKVENDFIRFTGMKKEFHIKKIGHKGSPIGEHILFVFDLSYVMRIDFKDGKYRLSLESYKIIDKESGNVLTLESFVKNGNVEDDYYGYGVLNYYSFKEKLPLVINELNSSLYNYIIGKTEKQKDDW